MSSICSLYSARVSICGIIDMVGSLSFSLVVSYLEFFLLSLIDYLVFTPVKKRCDRIHFLSYFYHTCFQAIIFTCSIFLIINRIVTFQFCGNLLNSFFIKVRF